MSKTVAFKRVATTVQPETPAEAWVATRNPSHADPAPAMQVEPMKRFTIDVTSSLHTRIKTQCAMRGTKMADVIRDLLEKEFPAA